MLTHLTKNKKQEEYTRQEALKNIWEVLKTHFGKIGLFFRLDSENLISAYKNRPHSVFLPDEKNPQSCYQKRF